MTMDHRISSHQVLVFIAVRSHGGWMTAKEIGDQSNVAHRTARHHASKLQKAGILEVAKLFGGYRYRLKKNLQPVEAEQISQIEEAAMVLGLEAFLQPKK